MMAHVSTEGSQLARRDTITTSPESFWSLNSRIVTVVVVDEVLLTHEVLLAFRTLPTGIHLGRRLSGRAWHDELRWCGRQLDAGREEEQRAAEKGDDEPEEEGR
jgi:hypothetical protein